MKKEDQNAPDIIKHSDALRHCVKQDSPLCRVNRYIKPIIIGGLPHTSIRKFAYDFPSEGSEGTLLMRVGSITLEITNSAGKYQTNNPLRTSEPSRKTTRLFIREKTIYNKAGRVHLLLNIEI